MKNGISMIPFGLLSGFMDGKEIRITELAEEGFRFRLSGKAVSPESFLICFYDIEQAAYCETEIRDYTMKERMPSEFAEFCTEYTVLTDHEEYRREVRKLQRQYSAYIRLKLEDDDEELVRVLTGYPEKKVDGYSDNNGNKVLKADEDCYIKSEVKQENNSRTEMALELDRPELYQAYLQKGIEWMTARCPEWNCLIKSESLTESESITGSRSLMESMMGSKKPDRIYIGNQFCHLLFPEEEELFALLDKAYAESLKITVAFSYIREFMRKPVETLLHRLEQWCRQKDTCIEIIVNDWAMADMIAEQNKITISGENEDIVQGKRYLLPCLGILLNKRKKDPRFQYKKGNKTLYQQNNLNADFYREYLQNEFGIRRYEWESCGYEQKFPQGQNSLHFPYYQTNTSQYCPLYAVCTTGNRGAQHLAENCPHYCREYTLAYPEYFNMTGRFNSLFGIDKELINHPEKLRNYTKSGIDRIVISWR